MSCWSDDRRSRENRSANCWNRSPAIEARPPRQIDDKIPKELERICLKALSKRASERYTTAKDMADDLRHFLAEAPGRPLAVAAAEPAVVSPTPAPPADAPRHADATAPATPSSDSQPIKIVPKGLRSFDAHDADFFLELLPGPARPGRFARQHAVLEDADRGRPIRTARFQWG